MRVKVTLEYDLLFAEDFASIESMQEFHKKYYNKDLTREEVVAEDLKLLLERELFGCAEFDSVKIDKLELLGDGDAAH